MINVIIAAGLLMATVGPAAASPFKRNERVVVIYADTADNATLRDQRGRLLAERPDLEEREMVVFAVLADGAVEAIYGTAPTPAEAKRLPGGSAVSSSFSVVLIGKDGRLKHSSSVPLDADVLFAMIDAMPMRKQEMRSKT